MKKFAMFVFMLVVVLATTGCCQSDQEKKEMQAEDTLTNEFVKLEKKQSSGPFENDLCVLRANYNEWMGLSISKAWSESGVAPVISNKIIQKIMVTRRRFISTAVLMIKNGLDIPACGDATFGHVYREVYYFRKWASESLDIEIFRSAFRKQMSKRGRKEETEDAVRLLDVFIQSQHTM